MNYHNIQKFWELKLIFNLARISLDQYLMKIEQNNRYSKYLNGYKMKKVSMIVLKYVIEYLNCLLQWKKHLKLKIM